MFIPSIEVQIHMHTCDVAPPTETCSLSTPNKNIQRHAPRKYAYALPVSSGSRKLDLDGSCGRPQSSSPLLTNHFVRVGVPLIQQDES